MNVLSLCDRTGVMVRPWAEAGHKCYIVDVQHKSRKLDDGIYAVGGDVRSFNAESYEPGIVFAFPPCTHLAVSGARWFRDKGLKPLIEALEIVEACRVICEEANAPWMIENPVSVLSTYWRPPDYTFHPYEYGGYVNGDRYTKKTCIWCGGGFVMPLKRPLEPTEGGKIHRMPPSKNRGDLRSVTPEGFARAVFEANAPKEEAINEA